MAAQAWPMFQVSGQTNFPSPTTDFFHSPISLSPVGSLGPFTSQLRADGVQEEGPRLKASLQQIFVCPLQGE